MNRVSVVVPTYNEAENISSLVKQIDDALRGIAYEVIFVDDSVDNTPEVIEAVMRENPNVRIRHRAGETGLATAVLEGFQMAEGDCIAVMDADLQHPPKLLRSMVCCLESGADICVPSRFIPGGSDGGLGPYRKLVSGVARYTGKILLPVLRRISDPTSGLFMFRREVISGANLQPIGWKILTEVLATGTYRTVIEIPYQFQPRPAGESKFTFRATMAYLKQLAGLMKRGKKQRRIRVIRWSDERMKAAEEVSF